MIKYVDTRIVFQEIPDEITLAINISNCPCGCKGCHSSYLSEDIGAELNKSSLNSLIKHNEGITCVCFMGGDSSVSEINKLASYIRESNKILKIGWYSGRQYIPEDINIDNFDYIKIGPYIEKLGGLTSKNTNQILYKTKPFLTNITYKLWKQY